MEDRGMFRRLCLVCILAMAAVSVSSHQSKAATPRPKWMKITLEVGKGTGDDPMTVIWLETKNKSFVKTLRMVSKDKTWFHSLDTWYKKHHKSWETKGLLCTTKKCCKTVDAVSGATMKWNSKRTLWLPLTVKGKSILQEKYVLRFETSRDKGGHYRSLKVRMNKDFKGGIVIPKKHYLKKVSIRLYKKKKKRKSRQTSSRLKASSAKTTKAPKNKT